MRVLIVEDEEAMADALKFILEQNGYQVDVAYDGITGEAYALTNIYDVFVLDRMLPGKEGVEIIKALRSKGIKTPAMFLTAKNSVDSRVEGLDTGADDYLIKPFSNREFISRVNALARRSSSVLHEKQWHIAGASLDVHKCVFHVDGKEIRLTKTEAQLLELLVRNKGQVLKKEIILDRIWGFDKDIELANVELYIYYLRKKIDFPAVGLELKTIRGVGYCLEETKTC